MVTNVLYLFIVIFSVNSVLATDATDSCRKCKTGFYVKQQCNENHDTVCAPCTSGYFMDIDDNYAHECNMCTICHSGTYTLYSCTPTSDTKCSSCDVKSDSESYRTSCQNKSDSLLNIGEGVKLDSLEEDGSGEEVVHTIRHGNVSVVSAEELEDGSGETILDIPNENIHEDNSSQIQSTTITTTKQISYNITDENDLLIPVIVPDPSPSLDPSTTPSAQSTTSTKATAVPASSTAPPTSKLSTTTPAPTLDLGIGIDIKDDGEPDEPEYVDVIVQPLEKTTVTETTKKPSESAVAHRKSAMSDDSDKVSIGIVVAVAIIAALVFFAIGFIAAKYCRRRRRTMKLMKHQNGHNNGSVPVMVEAPKPYKSDGIYDEIGKEPNGTCSTSKLDEIVPVHAENVYAVPNKPKKAASNDEIKYIDETTDDDDIDNKEGERLLVQATSDDVEQNGDVPETIDESSPMLTEIQSEMENKQDQPTETDALMEKS